MVSDSAPDPRRSALDAQMRADTLAVLRDSLTWQLTEARWASVAATLASISAALAAGEGDGVQSAVYDLEFLGPVRATGIGQTPVVTAPPTVREEINLLIHTLNASSGSPK
jgi:hypothetical protein